MMPPELQVLLSLIILPLAGWLGKVFLDHLKYERQQRQQTTSEFIGYLKQQAEREREQQDKNTAALQKHTQLLEGLIEREQEETAMLREILFAMQRLNGRQDQ